MIFRIAKLSDLSQIAKLHFKVRNTYSTGYFSKMGYSFIKQYYKIVLNDPYEVFVCAEDENNVIRGFCSASLDVVKQFSRLRKRKFQMGIAAIPTFLLKPYLVKDTIKRYIATKRQTDDKFIPRVGARCEFWTWDAEFKDSASSVALFNVFLSILYQLGVNHLPLEVDLLNNSVYHFHKINKASVIEEIVLSDGRKRILMSYDLKKRYSTPKIHV